MNIYANFTSGTAHPRRCGENRLWTYHVLTLPGSSPQVRGKPFVIILIRVYGRLIPAGAGKTGSNRQCQPRRTAHPRRCGENHGIRRHAERAYGSSPQVRGKHERLSKFYDSTRLIPAGAGKTINKSTLQMWYSAHPRRCGENTC